MTQHVAEDKAMLSPKGHRRAFPKISGFLVFVRLNLSMAAFVAGLNVRGFGGEAVVNAPRGSMTVYHTDDNGQIIKWVGPDSMEQSGPKMAPQRDTLIVIRNVPAGMSKVRMAAPRVHVTGLHLYGVVMTDEDLNFIAESCPDLRTLILSSPSVVRQDELSDLTDEERSTLMSKALADNSIARLAELKYLDSLEIRGYSMPSTRLQFLSSLKGLKRLILCDMNVTDDDMQSLRQLSRLEELVLAGTSVSGRGLRCLRSCRLLRSIVLDRTLVADELASHLQGHPWPNVQKISLHGCKISPIGIKALKAACPSAKIVQYDECCASIIPPSACSAQTVRDYRAAFALLSDINAVEFGKDRADSNSIFGAEVFASRRTRTGDWVHVELSAIKGLKELRIRGCNLSGKALATLQSHDQLEYLDLSKSTVDDMGIQHVANLPRLKSILLANTRLTDAGVATLSKLKNLEEINLANTGLTDRGLQALKTLPKLRLLQLKNCRITDEGAKQLASMLRMEVIGVSNTQVTDVGVREFRSLRHLRIVNAINCQITDEGARQLAQIPDLETIGLSGTRVTDLGVQALSSVLNLKHLSVCDCQITDAGAQALASIAGLEMVGLDGTQVTDRGLVGLSKLPRLKGISLNRCNVTDAGAKNLLNSAHLESYRLEGTSVSRPMAMKLRGHVMDSRLRNRQMVSPASSTGPSRIAAGMHDP